MGNKIHQGRTQFFHNTLYSTKVYIFLLRLLTCILVISAKTFLSKKMICKLQRVLLNIVPYRDHDPGCFRFIENSTNALWRSTMGLVDNRLDTKYLIKWIAHNVTSLDRCSTRLSSHRDDSGALAHEA